MAQCKATSKRTGERCRREATPGHNVCYYHGARGGAPQNNDNSKKHGAYEKLILDRLDDEQKQVFESIPDDEGMKQELKILRYKLLRLLDPVERQVVVGGEFPEIATIEVDEVTKSYAIEKIIDGIRKLVKEMQGTEADDPLIEYVMTIDRLRKERKDADTI